MPEQLFSTEEYEVPDPKRQFGGYILSQCLRLIGHQVERGQVELSEVEEMVQELRNNGEM